MEKFDVSVLIPSRNCKYVAPTVDDIFKNIRGNTEVIVILDGYWPQPEIKEYPNLTIVHKPEVKGMRHSLNIAAAMARGKYLMKCDDHCMFGEGFDELLRKDMQEDWLAVPSRYAMDVEHWKPIREKVEYLFVTYPYAKDNIYGNGLHGRKWIGENGFGENMGKEQFYWMETKHRDKAIDDLQTFQGSCWFMPRDHYFRIGQLDEKHCDLMENEPQELGFKTWLIGGRCVINKNTWYAHMHKNERELDNRGRSWKLSWDAMRQTGRFQTWYWMNSKWPAATRKIDWFVEHFWPIPGWPENWREDKIRYEKENPTFGEKFRIFDPDGVDGLPLAEADLWRNDGGCAK